MVSLSWLLRSGTTPSPRTDRNPGQDLRLFRVLVITDFQLCLILIVTLVDRHYLDSPSPFFLPTHAEWSLNKAFIDLDPFKFQRSWWYIYREEVVLFYGCHTALVLKVHDDDKCYSARQTTECMENVFTDLCFLCKMAKIMFVCAMIFREDIMQCLIQKTLSHDRHSQLPYVPRNSLNSVFSFTCFPHLVSAI